MIKVIDNLSPSLDKMANRIGGGNLVTVVAVPVANRILGNARITVPVKTGDLLRTGRVEVLGDEVVVKFGGQNSVDYAQTVHEKYPWLAEATEAIEDDAIVDEVLKILEI